MLPLSRLVPALVAVGGIAAAATIAGLESPVQPDELPGLPGFQTFQPIPGCVEELPDPIPEPDIRPDSLPLPSGTYAVMAPSSPAPGLHVVVYLVPRSLDSFVEDHILAVWPERGWELGQGEREAGEAESVFYLPDRSRYGQIRARQIYCDQDKIELTLTLGEDLSKSPRNRP